jgi:DNA-binding NarL/FixJ family response regulator
LLNRTDIKMTDRDRSLVDLLVNDCLSNKELAEQLGVTESNVKKRIFSLCTRVGIAHNEGHPRIRLAGMFRPIEAKQVIRVRLTEKEWFIATCVAEGLANKAIAEKVGNPVEVVRNYIRSIFDKTGVWSRLELAAWVDAHHPEVQAHAG